MKLTFNNMENLTEHDLVWFFNHAQSDMGIKSNWSAMVSASMFGGAHDFHDSTNSFILNSVGHYRELEKVYKAMDRLNQEILYATFADVHISAYVQRIFKKLSGTAYCSHLTTPEGLEEACQRISTGKATGADRTLISKIRIDAQRKYQDCITSFTHTKYQFKKAEK